VRPTSQEGFHLYDFEGVFKGHGASKDKGRVLSQAQPRGCRTRLDCFRLSNTELFNSCETRDEQRWLRVDRVVQRLFRTLVSSNKDINREATVLVEVTSSERAESGICVDNGRVSVL
jgi:hypothetical protein